MPTIQFQHKTRGAMTTTPEYWVEYEVFDAVDEEGNTMPVIKDDCQNPRYFEE